MRIWLCPSAFAPHKGGVEELTLKLAQQLQRAGHDVLVVVHRHPRGLPASEVVEGVRVRRLHFAAPARSLSSLLAFVKDTILQQIRLGQLGAPDVVHIQCPSNQTLPLTAFSWRKRIPLVVSSQGETVMDATGIYARSAYVRVSLRLAAARAARLTACSSWTARQASLVAPAFEDAVIVPNGVDTRDWQVGEVPDEPVFCMWGRHVRQKGFDLAIDAFAEVRLRNPRATLLIGGDGPERGRLEGMSGDGIVFLGSLDRDGVREMLGRARVAIVPSRIEPFGIVAIEALASGRALVYSAGAGGLTEAAGDRGIPVCTEDRAAFAGALEQAVHAAPEPARNLERALEFSWESVSGRYEVLYRSVVGGAGP